MVDRKGDVLASDSLDAVRHYPMAVCNAFEALFSVCMVVVFVSSQRSCVLRQTCPCPDCDVQSELM